MRQLAAGNAGFTRVLKKTKKNNAYASTIFITLRIVLGNGGVPPKYHIAGVFFSRGHIL